MAERAHKLSEVTKTSVLQSCKAFAHAEKGKSKSKDYMRTLAEFTHLLTKGEVFTPSEIQDVFFGVTKLFLLDVTKLRLMVYIAIKTVAAYTSPDDVIIVIQSLCKDINSDNPIYKAKALSVISCIATSVEILATVERYIKQAFTDSNTSVRRAALMAAQKISVRNPDFVRKWTGLIQDLLKDKDEFICSHAFNLMMVLKAKDRIATFKIIEDAFKHCAEHRFKFYLASVMKHFGVLCKAEAPVEYTDVREATSPDTPVKKLFLSMLEKFGGQDRRKEAGVIEMIRLIGCCPFFDTCHVTSSPLVVNAALNEEVNQITHFGALRAMLSADWAKEHLRIITSMAKSHVERLFKDHKAKNPMLAAMSVCVDLRSGSNHGKKSVGVKAKRAQMMNTSYGDDFTRRILIDKLYDISFNFNDREKMGKVVSMDLKPFLMLAFAVLRERTMRSTKKVCVNLMLKIAEVPEYAAKASYFLTEYLEDCDIKENSRKIMNHLADKVINTPDGYIKYFRYILNRFYNESGYQRATAISIIGKIANALDDFVPEAIAHCKRFLMDRDEFVSTRAHAVLCELEGKARMNSEMPMDEDKLLKSIEMLEAQIESGDFDDNKPITWESMPMPQMETVAESSATTSASATASPTTSANIEYPEEIAQFVEDRRYFYSSAHVALTESELEYVVTCVRHMYQNMAVLEYSIENTLPDQELRDVSLVPMFDDDGATYEIVGTTTLSSIHPHSTGKLYLVLKYEDMPQSSCGLLSELKFFTVEGDDEPFEDSFELEDMEMGFNNFVIPTFTSNFAASWENLSHEHRCIFRIPAKGAVNNTAKSLGLHINNETMKDPHTHMLQLSGRMTNDKVILVKALIEAPAKKSNATLKLQIRSEVDWAAKAITHALG
eukprot:TRINITY_DN936_c2_g1_i1.p1 TRINITY_DN936_c2_g1~~TRINITY_DN936_c2_g1_i1.p1  ORF type:complete len:890 (+),score=270.05 TRINITY_DN936_c2_g1_i1:72-2741(+)